MGLTYISKSCEIYLGEDSAYREDMGSLPLDCIISAEEYNALPEEQKKEYAVLVPKSRGQGPGARGQFLVFSMQVSDSLTGLGS